LPLCFKGQGEGEGVGLGEREGVRGRIGIGPLCLKCLNPCFYDSHHLNLYISQYE